MAWACCEIGWRKGNKQVTERQTRWREKKGRPSLRWMDDVEMDLRKKKKKKKEKEKKKKKEEEGEKKKKKNFGQNKMASVVREAKTKLKGL
jgi:hypothetical protein